MKFIISLCYLISSPLYAQQDLIRISFHESERLLAEKVQSQLEQEYFIPKEFVRMVEDQKPCERRREKIQWHLCINTNGNLNEVSADRTFKNETLKVFL